MISVLHDCFPEVPSFQAHDIVRATLKKVKIRTLNPIAYYDKLIPNVINNY